MNENQEVETRKRRSRGEVKRLVAEFEASGIQRNEFCRTHGIALSTLQRHLKRHGSGVGRAKGGNRLGGRRVVRTGAEKEFPKGLCIGSGFTRGTTD